MSGDEADGVIDVQGSYVITSTSAVQRAHAPEGARYSAFTGELVALLAEGSAESGSLIRLDDIYAHLRQRLTGRGLPKPQQRGVDTAADLALTRNPAWSAPPAAHRRR
jgi:ATP-dependent Clp protease ATP-binding subunit ClpC